ncbi:MAG: hypothetical protein P8Y70_04345 [Candidatus Lokiarchaeota archaeon]
MHPNSFWKKELIETLKYKKTLVIKIILPLILSIPLLIPGIPFDVKSNLFTLIIIFISTFGSAVGLIQLKENKIIERLKVLPTSEYRLIFEYLFINSLMDCVKLGIPIAILLVYNLGNLQILPMFWVLLNFIISITFANALGIIVAILAKTSGEGHLYSIIMVLGISFLSGLFFISLPFSNLLYTFIPFHFLAISLIGFWKGILNLSFFPFIALILIFILIFVISPKLYRLE